jgi:hypothetical protein
MVAMGNLVTFLLYSAVVFYVVIIAESLRWILVTVAEISSVFCAICLPEDGKRFGLRNVLCSEA